MRYLALVLISIFSLGFGGCASITSSEMQSIAISSIANTGEQVTAAKCSLINDKGKWSIETPTVVSIHKSSQDLLVDCEKEGSDKGFVRAVSSASAGMYGNIIFGGIVGAVIDHSKGSGYEYPSNIAVIMGSQNVVYVNDQKIILPVTSDKSAYKSNAISNDSENAVSLTITERVEISCTRCLDNQSCPFADNKDGTVTDKRNNRVWMRCSYGQQWNGRTCVGEAEQVSVMRAKTIGKQLQIGDKFGWRIPQKSEMSNLISSTCLPMVNAEVFPNTPMGEYVSFDATQSDWHAHYFNLKNGDSYNASHGGNAKSYIRFVSN